MSVFPGAGKADRSKLAGQERQVSAPGSEDRWSFLST